MMEIESGGAWHKMTHVSDGYFQLSLHVPGSFRVRLTAINGAQIIDTIPGIRQSTVVFL